MLSRADFLASSAAALTLPVLASARGRRRRVRFGVNYVPSKNWWYSWSDWDAASIARDLDDIAALRADHIRIQLLWPYFQPNEHFVSAAQIARLGWLLDASHERDLDVEVTVLDGQLSGFLFTPAFLIDNQNGRIRNFITDPHLLAVQKDLFTHLAAAIGSHPAFLGFDIANEIYWFTQPLGVQYSPAQGDAWMNALLQHCRKAAPGRLHVNGVDKWPYESSAAQGFTRQALAHAGGASCIHPWAGFGPVFQKDGPLSVQATHYAEFFLQYMQAFSPEGNRLLWIEEDGCSKQWVPQALIPRWAAASIRNAASCANLFGITWWCSHDVNPSLRGFNKLEYDLGLYTNDRVLKPLGRAFREIVAEFDDSPPHAVPRPHALVIEDTEGGDQAMPRFMRALGQGVRPQIVLRSRSGDAAYLKRRGIQTLLR